MSGVAGFLDSGGRFSPRQLRQAMSQMNRRGPDDEGLVSFSDGEAPKVFFGSHTVPGVMEVEVPWKPILDIQTANDVCDVSLGHRRLETSAPMPSEHQPVSDVVGDIWCVFDGAVYNFRELRADLGKAGYQFRTEAEAEVVVAAFATWGEGFVRRLKGSFAIAIFHRRTGALYLFRDRFGVKPLYFSKIGQKFLFASNPETLLQLDPALAEVNEEAAYYYLRHEVIDQSDQTLYREVRSLPAGHFLRWNFRTRDFLVRAYYNMPQAVSENVDLIHPGDIREELLSRLRKSVRESYGGSKTALTLGGGLDSPTIAAVVRELVGTSGAINTFTAHYGISQQDEDEYVDLVTERLRTQHRYELIDPTAAARDLVSLVDDLGEPVTRAGVYSQWKIFQRIHQEGFRVSMDGQGADEMFGGFDDYFGAYFEYLRSERRGLRYYYDLLLLCRHHGMATSLRLVHFLKNTPEKSQAGLKRDFLERFVGHSPYPPTNLGHLDPFNKALFWSFAMGSLPHSLRVSDRCSTSHSVESRLPYLDHELVELAFSLLPEEKMGAGYSKRVLRQSARRLLPEKVWRNQRKKGLHMAHLDWFRTPEFSKIFKEVIHSRSFRDRGFFNQQHCAETYERFLSGGAVTENFWLWLNFELWAQRKIDTFKGVREL